LYLGAGGRMQIVADGLLALDAMMHPRAAGEVSGGATGRWGHLTFFQIIAAGTGHDGILSVADVWSCHLFRLECFSFPIPTHEVENHLLSIYFSWKNNLFFISRLLYLSNVEGRPDIPTWTFYLFLLVEIHQFRVLFFSHTNSWIEKPSLIHFFLVKFFFSIHTYSICQM
jgi:hypothetical protein